MRTIAELYEHRNQRIIRGILVFIAVLGIVGCIMYFRIETLLHTHLERQVSEQVRLTAEVVSEELNAEFRDLKTIARGIQNDPKHGSYIVDSENADHNGVTMGILTPDGNAFHGNLVSYSEFPAIKRAFH